MTSSLANIISILQFSRFRKELVCWDAWILSVPKFALIQVYILQWHNFTTLWDACSDYLREKSQKMQNRAGRDITGKSYQARSSEILADLGWQTLDRRLKTKMATFWYNIRNNNDNEPWRNMFKLSNCWACVFNLRINEINFQIPKPRTMKKSVRFFGLTFWNDLSTTAK